MARNPNASVEFTVGTSDARNCLPSYVSSARAGTYTNAYPAAFGGSTHQRQRLTPTVILFARRSKSEVAAGPNANEKGKETKKKRMMITAEEKKYIYLK